MHVSMLGLDVCLRFVSRAMIRSVIKANLKANWILYCNRKKQKSDE